MLIQTEHVYGGGQGAYLPAVYAPFRFVLGISYDNDGKE